MPSVSQNIARKASNSLSIGAPILRGMAKTSSKVLARNLKKHMQARQLTQSKLAELSGVAQTSIGYMLNPGTRAPTATGKEPSATLAQIDKVAGVFRLQSWQLLLDEEVVGQALFMLLTSTAVLNDVFQTAVPDAYVEQHLPHPIKSGLNQNRSPQGGAKRRGNVK
jgi:transcriptional regulator with XRE-family HTH domain